MKLLQVTIVLATVACSLVTAQLGNLTAYGLLEPTTASCGGLGAGTRIDRMYASKCFVRQVVCDAANEVTSTETCDNVNEIYIMDGDNSCVATDSSDAQTNCGVTVHCGDTEMSVHVTGDAIWGQTDAALQFGTSLGGMCDIVYGSGSYDGSLSLLTSGNSGYKWDDCGATREIMAIGEHMAVKYSFIVGRSMARTEREQEDHGAVITREKNFKVDVNCYYKTDGTASSSYKPTAADALTKSDENTLDFEMYPIECSSGNKISSQSVFVGETVCFETSIMSNWHQDIRISTTNCWATPNADDAPEGTKYNLTTDGSGGTADSTFEWMCYNGRYKEKFSFEAFRFAGASNTSWGIDENSEDQYAQTVHIHCEVNACGATDIGSEDCTLHTDVNNNMCTVPNSRRRRAVSGDDMSVISRFTKGKTMTKMYVIEPESPNLVTYNSPRYNLLSDTLSMAMFATGCIFAVVAVGLLVVMKRAKSQMKYRVLNVE